MHELSIATGLLEQTLAAMQANGASRVDELDVRVGMLRQVVDEAMEFAWRAVTEGTPAAGSVLRITEVKPSCRCRICEGVFEPMLDNYLCPKCKQANVEILAGNDIILQTLTCSVDEGVGDE